MEEMQTLTKESKRRGERSNTYEAIQSDATQKVRIMVCCFTESMGRSIKASQCKTNERGLEDVHQSIKLIY